MRPSMHLAATALLAAASIAPASLDAQEAPLKIFISVDMEGGRVHQIAMPLEPSSSGGSPPCQLNRRFNSGDAQWE